MADVHVQLDGTHDPVGQCIYCGSIKQLGDEHIVPYCLGGGAILPKASCRSCEAITSNLEGIVGRPIFGPMRSYYRIKKRKRRAGSDHTIIVDFETDNGPRQERVPVFQAPPILMLHTFQDAGLFHENEPSPVASGKAWVWYSEEVDEYMKRLRKPGDKSWRIRIEFDAQAFARVLAKIAHATAIAHFGLGSFKPFLPDIIRGIDTNTGYYIGAGLPPTDPDPPLQAGKHQVHHRIAMTQLRNDKGHVVLAAAIQLFPFTGAPTYTVIVGEPGPELAQQLS
jgi:hypothetical protein